ncbi:unnamed protein product [Arctogadus glacialis]
MPFFNDSEQPRVHVTVSAYAVALVPMLCGLLRPAGERRAAPVRWEPGGVVERAVTAVLPHSDSLFNADKRRAS